MDDSVNEFMPTPSKNHFQRVVSTLEHRKADRVPLTWGSPSCSMHRTANENLLSFLSLTPQNEPLITDDILQIVETDPRILDYFDIDLLWLLPRTAEIEWNEDRTAFTDTLGRKFVSGGGFFNQIQFPLYDCSADELLRYQFPELDPNLYSHLGFKAKESFAKGYGLGIDGPWGLYEISSSLVGTSEFLMDLILNPPLACAIAERVLYEYLIPFYDLLLADTGPYVQIVGISDDLGSQTGMLFSPNVYRQIFKPLHKKLIDHIHSLTNAKIYMHSDGSIYPIVPDLIEIGVDGLNPVQYTAKDMGLEKLVNDFGQDLGFFGGVIENEVLSFRSPDEVRALVIENATILRRNNAFIFAPIHNISQEVPPENIIALYKAGLELIN